jgi:hypothetical protein
MGERLVEKLGDLQPHVETEVEALFAQSFSGPDTFT